MSSANNTMQDDFDDDLISRQVDAFVIDVDGYEGPLDVLLNLARDQKVDITQVSILQLANQFLAFVVEVRSRNLELAADYLVMAAWLAYMKSKLLLPDMDEEDQPTGSELAAVLAFQLKRLEAMRDAGAKMMNMKLLGRDFFARGEPEIFKVTLNTVFDANLHDLMRAYGDMKRREAPSSMTIEAVELYTVDLALSRIRAMLGSTPEWKDLWLFLPTDITNPLIRRSAIASTFTATLELAREGKLDIRQTGTFGQIYISAKNEENSDTQTEDTEET